MLQPPQAQLLDALWCCKGTRALAPLLAGGVIWGQRLFHLIQLPLHVLMRDSHKINNPGYFLKLIAHEQGERTQLFRFQQFSAPGGQTLPLRGSADFQLSLTTVPYPSNPCCLFFVSAQPPCLLRAPLVCLPDKLKHQRNEIHPPGEEKGLAGAEDHIQGSGREGRGIFQRFRHPAPTSPSHLPPWGAGALKLPLPAAHPRFSSLSAVNDLLSC